MDPNEAKSKRTSAKRMFTRKKNGCVHAIEDELDEEIVNQRFEEVQKAWKSVQITHEEFIEASEFPADQPEMDEWIMEVEGVFEELEMKRVSYLRKREERVTKINEEVRTSLKHEAETSLKNELNEKIVKARRARKMKYLLFQNQADFLSGVLDRTVSDTHPIEVAATAYDSLLSLFDKVEKTHYDLMQLLDESEGEREVHWMVDVQTVVNGLTPKFCSYKSKHAKTMVKEKDPSPLGLKMERMSLPKFAGDLREYFRFKSDFEKYVLPTVEKKNAAYVLKSCLSGTPKKLVQCLDDDLHNIWERLDEKYGRVTRVADVILNDIRKQKAIREGDESAFVKFVDIIENGYWDLEKLKLGGEISNSIVLSLIEEKLPKNVKHEWAKEINKKTNAINEKEKFPKFLNFLTEQRKIVEYENDNVRSLSKTAFQNTNCWLHPNLTHKITSCYAFQNMGHEEKLKAVKGAGVCWSCLEVGHTSSECSSKLLCGENNCKRTHHPLLHVDEASGHTSTLSSLNNNCILQIMSVKSPKSRKRLNVLWDGGSTISLITFKKAKEMNLKGKAVKLNVCKVGERAENFASFVYDVPLIDSANNVLYFKAFGFDKISSTVDQLKMGKFAEMMEIDENRLQRSPGEVDLLIGFEYAAYHPKTIKSINHLVLMKCRFGYCLGGTHPLLKENGSVIAQNASINFIKGETLEDFFVIESLGEETKERCKNCGDKGIAESMSYTLKEKKELEWIEKGLTFNGSFWTSNYPWKSDPLNLPNNRSVALACLASNEKRLRKNPQLATTYSDQIYEMINNGVARKLTAFEIRNYKGAIHYVSHHAVLKQSSSTPCRIVFNSSAKYQGKSLNDYWAKGPDLMNNLVGVLLRFRENYFAAVGDIIRMYHSVRISEADQHVHRFLWRDLQQRPVDEFVITRVSFGDRPSGAIATLALRKTALMSLKDNPDAVKTIIRNSYVDDILDSFSTEEEAKATTKAIEVILEKGSFKMKSWIFSEQKGQKFVIKTQGITEMQERGIEDFPKVLGLIWDSETDVFRFSVNIDLHFKKGLVKDVSTDDVVRSWGNGELKFTKRSVLSKINSIFDPIGLAAPLIVKAKIMMRKIWIHEPKLNWDDDLPQSMAKGWVNFFVELLKMNEIEFPRCIKPRDLVNNDPELIIFSDASESAFGSCAYVRWEIQKDVFKTTLVMAKSRIAPTKKTTIVRLELNAALLAVRIKKFLSKECRLQFKSTCFIVDTKVVLGMINHQSHIFNTYVGVRISEIQDESDSKEWFWVESKKNVADILTRGAPPEQLGCSSEWQNGPPYLALPKSQWPVQQPCSDVELPEVKSTVNFTKVEVCDSLASRISIHKHSSYNKLIRITARILLCYQRKAKFSFKNACLALEYIDLQRAEIFWVLEVQSYLGDLRKFLRLAPKVRKDGVVIVGTRCEVWLNDNYNNNQLILLPYDHYFSKLYVQHIHRLEHLGVASTICKVRNRFWIINITRLVKTIVNECVTCRKQRRLLEQQIMAPLPINRLKPAPAWYTTHIDYFGPFPLKGEVNKRTRGKGFGIIFTCALTRAIHLDLSSNYNADGFKQALRRFVALRGYPGKFVSDKGSQLVAVAKELKSLIKNLDWDEIKAFGVEEGVTWEFSPPTGPWMNGCAESMVKGVKKAMKHAIGSQCLSYPEMQTALFEIANLVNERPIGKHPDDPNDGHYLSPNEMLLGRATARVPSGPFKEPTSTRQRHEFIQSIVNAYWKKWTRDFFPTLLIRQKWHTERRNVMVDDVVLVQESNALRGQWFMGRVRKVFPGADGRVRRCEVAYHTPPDNKNEYVPCKTFERPIHKLVIIIPADEKV